MTRLSYMLSIPVHARSRTINHQGYATNDPSLHGGHVVLRPQTTADKRLCLSYRHQRYQPDIVIPRPKHAHCRNGGKRLCRLARHAATYMAFFGATAGASCAATSPPACHISSTESLSMDAVDSGSPCFRLSSSCRSVAAPLEWSR